MSDAFAKRPEGVCLLFREDSEPRVVIGIPKPETHSNQTSGAVLDDKSPQKRFSGATGQLITYVIGQHHQRQ